MSKKKKSNCPEWSKLIKQAVDISGEKKILSSVEGRCGQFEDISSLEKYIETIPQGDRSTRGWLANSLKTLGKERKTNKYANFSKLGKHTLDQS